MTGWAGFGVLTGASLVWLAVLQTVAFAIGHRIGRYNVVDVGWGLGFVGVALLALSIGDGDPLRRWLLAGLVTLWGVRLSWHMYIKCRGHGEDPRYTALLAKYDGPPARIAARRVFGTQGAAQWFVSLPVQVSAVCGPTSGPAVVVLGAGVALWIMGFGFEATGDAQLRRFKADPANAGTIMDSGVWAWSRHPNYFGDACLWWGIWLVAASAWPGVVTVASPMAMTYFLVVATGARLLERSMSDRPGYAEYRRRTSFFLPRPPRRRDPSGG
ncbi:DUF1295 domain-containing protein [Gordonia sp. (in: high G+C Gram-positive bacteria)]|uniref:DUF1295 domain-containing protein n=1 Tax=Gordonia sp. (in: high G+C Gram-positive bacteria) TaxID=84139 RepID=UPI00260407F9|nr:DUF1295 domain-containing protein [Gordonia sp. (in: high G+C Gram-positive bacteria)]